MGNMRFKVGDKVRIKSLDWYNENKDKDGIVEFSTHIFTPGMSQFCGKVVTIEDVFEDTDNNVVYYIEEIDYDWTYEMIEGLVEDDVDLIPKFGEYSDNEPLDIPTMTTEFVKEHGLPCPNGYIFKDENGNVINATKIVLEKKKKAVNLTQEQINKMVNDSCVLFCKHCGCGIPRDTCTSLGTCKEHDEYRAAIRTHLMEKKKEYPKTYEECCKVLGYDDRETYCIFHTGADERLFEALYRLKVCRDAYWKIAGEEMGLGKPWEPDWNCNEYKYGIQIYENKVECIMATHTQIAFPMPTEEMRDVFYENFKEEIESCKELL